MRLIKIVGIVLVTMVAFIQAQTPLVEWEKNFGGSEVDKGYDIKQMQDKGYIIVGETYSFGDDEFGDVYLIKTDSSGNLKWEKTFGGHSEFWGEDWGSSVQQTQDKGCIITGSTQSFNDTIYRDVYLIKTDSSGNLQWQKTFGGIYEDVGNSVQQTIDKGYIITGCTQSFNDSIEGDVYLIKTDSLGNLQWQKTFGGSGEDAGFSIQQTNDKGYIVIGKKEISDISYAYLIKTDSLGNYKWEKTFGGCESKCGTYSGLQTVDKGYIITGLTVQGNQKYTDVYLLKTDSLGNIQWEKTFGGNKGDYGNFIQQTKDKGYIIVGETQFLNNNKWDVYLIKTDSLGNLQWQLSEGAAGYDEGHAVQQTQDGGYIIVGEYFKTSEEDKDVYLIKIRSEVKR